MALYLGIYCPVAPILFISTWNHELKLDSYFHPKPNSANESEIGLKRGLDLGSMSWPGLVNYVLYVGLMSYWLVGHAERCTSSFVG